MRQSWHGWAAAALIPAALWTGFGPSVELLSPATAEPRLLADMQAYGKQSALPRSKSRSSAAGTVQQAANYQAPRTAKPPQAPVEFEEGESELQRELREVYRKNGREMPVMDMQELEVPDPEPGQVTQPGEGQDVRFARPAAPVKQPNFFERVILGRKPVPAAPRQAPAANVPPATAPRTASPSQTQRPLQYRPAPAPNRGAPHAEMPRQLQQPGQIAPQVPAEFQRPATQRPPQGIPSLLPGTTAAAREDSFFEDTPTFENEPEESLDISVDKPGIAAEMPAEDLVTEPSESAPDMADEPTLTTPASDEPTPGEAPVEENPFTGLKLNLPNTPAAAPAATGPTQAEQMQKLKETTENSATKGFCLVTLRKQRRLIETQPELRAVHDGVTYHFATAAAQAEFEKRPELYVPAYQGHDAVAWMDDEDKQAGSLDHAAWYQGRLYLFTSAASLETFNANPDLYFEELPGAKRPEVQAPLQLPPRTPAAPQSIEDTADEELDPFSAGPATPGKPAPLPPSATDDLPVLNLEVEADAEVEVAPALPGRAATAKANRPVELPVDIESAPATPMTVKAPPSPPLPPAPAPAPVPTRQGIPARKPAATKPASTKKVTRLNQIEHEEPLIPGTSKPRKVLEFTSGTEE